MKTEYEYKYAVCAVQCKSTMRNCIYFCYSVTNLENTDSMIDDEDMDNCIPKHTQGVRYVMMQPTACINACVCGLCNLPPIKNEGSSVS